MRPKVNADGTFKVFHSRASNLVNDDTNGHADVFLYDIENDQIIRATNFTTVEEGNAGSSYPDINGDGKKLFLSQRAQI